jgi:hypothetical protein
VELFGQRITHTIATLRALLPARITAFNATGGVQLDTPADDGGVLKPIRPELGYVFGGLPYRPADQYPYLEVAIPDGLLQELAIQQVAGDLDSSVVVAIWAGRTEGEGFPDLYEKVLGYTQCVTEVILQPDAVYPGEVVDRIRFAFAANPDQRDRSEMETFTFGGFVFVTTLGTVTRP